MRFASKLSARLLARRVQRALLPCVLAASWTAAAHADDLYVICNAGVSMQAGEVRDLFTGEKSFAGRVRLTPADNLASQTAFLELVLKLNSTKYASLWTKKAFRDGSNPPLVKNSDAEAVAYVLQTPGGCSYTTSAPPASVAVIARY